MLIPSTPNSRLVNASVGWPFGQLILFHDPIKLLVGTGTILKDTLQVWISVSVNLHHDVDFQVDFQFHVRLR